MFGRGYRPPAPRRGAVQIDPFATLGDLLRGAEEAAGIRLEKQDLVIGESETFRQWCERLGESGMKVDGKPFRLDNRPAMAWIYDQIPSTRDEAYRLILVLMKCAQVGFTVMEMLAAIYLGIKFGPSVVGMFLPDMNLAGIKSSERFMPLVRSVPTVHQMMTQDADDGSGVKGGEGNVTRRRIGNALFIFSWTSGRATTESVPMDILSFDEVQEMTIEQMEKTLERLSASDLRFVLMGSTANWPDSDIHFWYKRGSQVRFHSRCPTCGRAEPIDDYFPNCFKWIEEQGAYRYTCRDGHILDDPQDGDWIAANPSADPAIDPSMPIKDRPRRIRSIHFPQFLSPTISPTEFLDAYRTAESMKNFYNRKLGKPYLDPSLVPVTMEHLLACEEAGKKAGLVWKKSSRGSFMGIDQMGNFNVVVIKERMPDGRQAVIHLEMIYSSDPFKRCDELMELYAVQVCVVEINPNYNDAKKFSNRWPGRVFICDSFGKIAEGMIAWGDAPKLDASDRRTTEEDRDRYTLKMDQYKCMQVSMYRWVNGQCLTPGHRDLVDEVREKGVSRKMPVLPVLWDHFLHTALVSERDDETNKHTRSVKKIGIDPHFSYANMLCDVAWARAYGTTTFLMPSADAGEKAPEVKKSENMNMHGLPQAVAAVIKEPDRRRVCGNCSGCDDSHGDRAGEGLCSDRQIMVRLIDPACEMFDPVSS